MKPTESISAGNPAEPTLTFWGAAGGVTGSMHLVEVGNHKVLLDCGLHQGRREEARQRNGHFPFHPKQIDAVILGHAHIDHCGNLPTLVRQGVRPRATRAEDRLDAAGLAPARLAGAPGDRRRFGARTGEV